MLKIGSWEKRFGDVTDISLESGFKKDPQIVII